MWNAIIMVVLMGIINWDVLGDSATPVLDVAEIAFESIGLAAVGVGLLTFAGLLATASSANASILASSRINFAMGRDKLISAKLNTIHPRFATPYRSIAVTGALILLFIVLGDVETLAKAGNVLHLVVSGLLNLGLIVMREADTPEYQPDFEVPSYPIVPILGAVTSVGLIAFMQPIEIALSMLFVLGGLVWYLVYARGKATKRGILSQYILQRSEAMPDAAVSAAAAAQPDGGDFRVMVALANPEHERALVELGATIAKQRGGTLVATHVVTVPDQTALLKAREHVDELDATTGELMARARADAEDHGVPIETHTILSHRGVGEVYDAARTHEADVVVMGWGETGHARVEAGLDEVSQDIPCDFLVLNDRDFDPERVLLPTAGGPDSDLGASVSRYLRNAYDSEVTLLHVADDREEGETFLETWADEHGLGDATRLVETGDAEAAIERAAGDATMMVIGATERGLLRRLVTGSLVLDVVDQVDCAVLMAEKKRGRSLKERLLGR